MLLFHGTSPESADMILKEGFKSSKDERIWPCSKTGTYFYDPVRIRVFESHKYRSSKDVLGRSINNALIMGMFACTSQDSVIFKPTVLVIDSDLLPKSVKITTDVSDPYKGMGPSVVIRAYTKIPTKAIVRVYQFKHNMRDVRLAFLPYFTREKNSPKTCTPTGIIDEITGFGDYETNLAKKLKESLTLDRCDITLGQYKDESYESRVLQDLKSRMPKVRSEFITRKAKWSMPMTGNSFEEGVEVFTGVYNKQDLIEKIHDTLIRTTVQTVDNWKPFGGYEKGMYIKKLAEIAGVSKTTVVSGIKKGFLRDMRVGTTRFVSFEDCLKLINKVNGLDLSEKDFDHLTRHSKT